MIAGMCVSHPFQGPRCGSEIIRIYFELIEISHTGHISLPKSSYVSDLIKNISENAPRMLIVLLSKFIKFQIYPLN